MCENKKILVREKTVLLNQLKTSGFHLPDDVLARQFHARGRTDRKILLEIINHDDLSSGPEHFFHQSDHRLGVCRHSYANVLWQDRSNIHRGFSHYIGRIGLFCGVSAQTEKQVTDILGTRINTDFKDSFLRLPPELL